MRRTSLLIPHLLCSRHNPTIPNFTPLLNWPACMGNCMLCCCFAVLPQAVRSLRESVDLSRLSRIALSNLEKDDAVTDYMAAQPATAGGDITIDSADAELDFEETPEPGEGQRTNDAALWHLAILHVPASQNLSHWMCRFVLCKDGVGVERVCGYIHPVAGSRLIFRPSREVKCNACCCCVVHCSGTRIPLLSPSRSHRRGDSSFNHG